MKQMKKAEMSITRLTNCYKRLNQFMGFICAGLLIAFAILTFDFDDDINVVVLHIYYMLFAVVIVLCEFQIKWLLALFGFMGNLLGKGIFILLVGISMFKKDFDLKSIIAIVLMACGAIYVVLYFLPARIKESTSSDKKYEEKKKKGTENK